MSSDGITIVLELPWGSCFLLAGLSLIIAPFLSPAIVMISMPLSLRVCFLVITFVVFALHVLGLLKLLVVRDTAWLRSVTHILLQSTIGWLEWWVGLFDEHDLLLNRLRSGFYVGRR